MPSLASVAMDYWKRSQHFQALAPGEREAFVTFGIKSVIADSHDARHQALLGRIVQRLPQAAAG